MTPLKSLLLAGAFGFVITAGVDLYLRGHLSRGARWPRVLLPVLGLLAILAVTWSRTDIAPLRGLASAAGVAGAAALLVFPSTATVRSRALSALLSLIITAVTYTVVGIPAAWARHRAETEGGCGRGVVSAIGPDVAPSQVAAYCACATAPLLEPCLALDLPWRFDTTDDCMERKFQEVMASGRVSEIRDGCVRQTLTDEVAAALYAAHARTLAMEMAEYAVRSSPSQGAPEWTRSAFARCVASAIVERCADKTFTGYRRCFEAPPDQDRVQRQCYAASFGAK